MAQVGAQAIVYNAGPTARRELQACQSCLRAVVADAASDQRHLLIIEQDDSLITSDRRVLYAAARNARCENSLRYEHRRAEEELLLALPDAIAWCWARGGRWRDLVRGIVIEEKRL